ncbi:MAG TPA: hypothetical protein VES97_11630, partial [Solirubrobacteraceae bacterium]|nr:hypothetical protein [Solirubrobacteraceae bacterium]
NASYPSGADTLFGGSAFLLGLPLIWAFQPFNAFVLATAVGPAWLLARRLGLDGLWAALAALTAVLPALVYAYELFGSVKEVTALGMILTLGCLAVLHRRWLRGSPAGAVPFAVVLAAGVSALGVAFGAWALVAVAVLAAVLLGDLLAGRLELRPALPPIAAGAMVALIAAWPTWSHLSRSVQVAQDIASTGNAGNLHAPLRAIQAFGVWLRGSYKLSPAGAALQITHALILLMFLLAVLGSVRLLRTRSFALAGWLAGMLLAWLAVSELVTTWAGAKTLMLTSPVLLLLSWGGVSALQRPAPDRSSWSLSSALSAPRPRPALPPMRVVASLLGLAIAGGVLVSDAMQYHGSNLAPTARYEELASLDSRFAGRGPALFADFDEYALYELRDLDVGGPDFAYPPPALAAAAGGYGEPVDLNRAPPEALLAYPLMVTRRDPSASRPPSAYRLLWQGAYYEVWGRRPGAAAAMAHRALSGPAAAQCRQIGGLARSAIVSGVGGARLVAAESPELVRISLAASSHPAR